MKQVIYSAETYTQKKARALALIEQLRIATKHLTPPMIVLLRKDFGNDSFIILISCLLSLRARDTVTYPICLELFKKVRTPEQMVSMPLSELEHLLFSLGFFRRKALVLHAVCHELITRFNSKVPCTLHDLLSIKGIGRKTANLVLGQAFGIPAICVDTHVHRISNQLGFVATKNPEQTEYALMALLPEKYWIEYTMLLVMWGQNKKRIALPE